MSSETFQYGQALLKYLKECNKEEFTKYTLDVHEKEEVDNEYDLLMDSETIDVKLIDLNVYNTTERPLIVLRDLKFDDVKRIQKALLHTGWDKHVALTGVKDKDHDDEIVIADGQHRTVSMQLGLGLKVYHFPKIDHYTNEELVSSLMWSDEQKQSFISKFGVKEISEISVKVTLIARPWNTESIHRLCNAINEQGKVEISEPLQLLRSLGQYVPKVQVRSSGKSTTYGKTPEDGLARPHAQALIKWFPTITHELCSKTFSVPLMKVLKKIDELHIDSVDKAREALSTKKLTTLELNTLEAVSNKRTFKIAIELQNMDLLSHYSKNVIDSKKVNSSISEAQLQVFSSSLKVFNEQMIELNCKQDTITDILKALISYVYWNGIGNGMNLTNPILWKYKKVSQDILAILKLKNELSDDDKKLVLNWVKNETSSSDPSSSLSYSLDLTGKLDEDFSYLKRQKFEKKTKYNLTIPKKTLVAMKGFLPDYVIEGVDASVMSCLKKSLLLSIKEKQKQNKEFGSDVSSENDDSDNKRGRKRERTTSSRVFNASEAPTATALPPPPPKGWFSSLFQSKN